MVKLEPPPLKHARGLRLFAKARGHFTVDLKPETWPLTPWLN